jgi:ADP-ribose pyrophosphatase YjhB (NUDIX family)
MPKAARAIIIENKSLLVMHRDKQGSQYFTLVGGQVRADESIEDALAREVNEETGLVITNAKLVFVEKHPAPYNDQYIFLCEVSPHKEVEIQSTSEEGFLNRIGLNNHTPAWATFSSFPSISFRTPQLHKAIIRALKSGFPNTPEGL